uniref:MPN domain-containing protein n=1 Tax=Parascaris univalens TaxID=6257 RepID=A0A914ZH59_PARUN
MTVEMHLLLDPAERMRTVLKMATPHNVNSAIPINRYYRSLNEMYRAAGYCLQDSDFEKAFIYYMRFVSLAIEELPKHKSYKGFVSAEKTKAEASLHKAIENAEQLKVRLKSVFDDEAKRARAQLDQEKMQREAMIKEKEALNTRKPYSLKNESSITPLVDPSISTDHIVFDQLDSYIKPVPPARNLPRSTSSSYEEEMRRTHPLVVAGKLVEQFAALAHRNTEANIETCAILCGAPMSYGVCRITHAVVPKQNGASDSCDTRNEEDVFAYQDAHNLITLGWIHTHPSQTAFLSSVDLHTHCSYQLMMPEAVAIVVAPKFNEVGVFRLTERGMQEISACHLSGFHPHEDGSALFYNEEAFFDNSLEAIVVDLR